MMSWSQRLAVIPPAVGNDMWTGPAQGYWTADSDDVILVAASKKFGVPIEQLELLRNDGCVLVRIRVVTLKK